jgi:ubiquinone/menaquinone biosynthesis C-methylase UbiE
VALAQHEQCYAEIAQSLGKTSSPMLVEALIALLRIERRHIVADIGGGAGGDAELLAMATGAQVVIVDRSRAMLRIGSQDLPRICGDALMLPLRSATFDAAYLVNMLQLFPDRRQLLGEVRRILRCGGRLALPVTSHAQLESRFINRFFPALLSIERQRYPSLSELVRLLRELGFSAIQAHEADVGSFVVDAAYLKRLQSGIFSGLGFLNPSQREQGFRKLNEWTQKQASARGAPVVRRVRTIITAEAQS